MIRFYATSMVPVSTLENGGERIQAIKALREIRRLAGERVPSLRQAKDDVDSGAEFFVAETTDQNVARRISQELDLASGLEWRLDTVPAVTGPPSLSVVPAEPSEPEEAPASTDERVMPSYEAAQVGLILLAIVDGNIGTAINGAISFSRVLEDESGKGDEFWNEVLVFLLDSFPVKGPHLNEGVESLAKRLRAGGFQ